MGVSIGIGSSPGGGGLTVVAETTLEADATDIEITGLDIDADGTYHIEIIGLGINNALFYSYFNGITTGYYRLRTNAAVASDAYILKGYSNGFGLFGKIIKTLNSSGDTVILFTLSNATTAEGDGVVKTFTGSGDVNLTQLNLTCATANGWGIGTKVKILKAS